MAYAATWLVVRDRARDVVHAARNTALIAELCRKKALALRAAARALRQQAAMLRAQGTHRRR